MQYWFTLPILYDTHKQLPTALSYCIIYVHCGCLKFGQSLSLCKYICWAPSLHHSLGPHLLVLFSTHPSALPHCQIHVELTPLLKEMVGLLIYFCCRVIFSLIVVKSALIGSFSDKYESLTWSFDSGIICRIINFNGDMLVGREVMLKRWENSKAL